jgi:hypothetical protein
MKLKTKLFCELRCSYCVMAGRLCVILLLTRGIVFKGVSSQIGLAMVKVYHEFGVGYVGSGQSV